MAQSLAPGDLDAAVDAIAGGTTADALETERLDFKRQGRSRADTLRDLAEAAACFANTLGGVIVVGIHDGVPGVAALAGTDLDPMPVSRRIYELTEPHLTVDVRVRDARGVRLLEIHVPRSPDIHQVAGRATHRVGKSCEPMSATMITTALAERRGDDWSDTQTSVHLDAVSPVAIGLARQLLRAHPNPRQRGYATATDADLLRVLGVVGRNGCLTQAGALLLCDPSDPTDLIVYQFRRTPASEPVSVERLTQPLLGALIRTIELIDTRVDKTPVTLPNGQQLHLADLPEAAAREAVANAVIHRDYRLTGPVRIEHSPSRLVVDSPGPLVLGVSVHNILTTSSRPRNPRLTAAIRMLGLAEEAGVGVDRMYREMVRIGHQPPRFVEESDRVRVTLLGGAPNAPLARYVATLPAAEADDADTMLILFGLLTRKTTTAAALVGVLQKDAEEVEDILRRLASEQVGMIEPTRETVRRKRPNYRLREHVVSALGPAVTYRRRTIDEYDRKIIELVREVGQVNARLVKITLDLTAERASRVLADLVERGLLVKTSQARRGPSVTYGPGPRFPTSRTRGRSRRSGAAERDANG